jgi:hypothetical protein
MIGDDTMVRTIALYLYVMGLVLPPLTVIGGLGLLVIGRRAEPRPASGLTRAA